MATPMSPQRLTERVAIERETTTPNGRGGRTVTWAPLVATPEMWAEVLPLTGDEAINNGIANAVQRWKVTVHLRRDVLPKDRLTWRGLVLDIRSAVPTIDRRWLVMVCESGLKA